MDSRMGQGTKAGQAGQVGRAGGRVSSPAWSNGQGCMQQRMSQAVGGDTMRKKTCLPVPATQSARFLSWLCTRFPQAVTAACPQQCFLNLQRPNGMQTSLTATYICCYLLWLRIWHRMICVSARFKYKKEMYAVQVPNDVLQGSLQEISLECFVVPLPQYMTWTEQDSQTS